MDDNSEISKEGAEWCWTNLTTLQSNIEISNVGSVYTRDLETSCEYTFSYNIIYKVIVFKILISSYIYESSL